MVWMRANYINLDEGINVLSLFDGKSCGRIALERAGIKVNKYFSSEIKPHALAVANRNWPQDRPYRLGDVTKISGKGLPKIDLLLGGSPCQDFSQANSVRSGVEGKKSSLFFHYTRLLRLLKPTYFLLENVKMKDAHQKIVDRELNCSPININSALVSAQLRNRYYWTNIPNITLPEDKNIQLNSILDSGYSDRVKARALLESDSRPLATPLKMVHRYMGTGFTTLIFKDENHYTKIKQHYTKHFKNMSASQIDKISHKIDTGFYSGVRYMTRTERERCQTVPVGYVDGVTDLQAACLLGDGRTVDVIAHIFKCLKPLLIK